MFTEKVNPPQVPRRRGRPPGHTAEGLQTRQRLFDAAIGLMAERGYGATTLRDVAERAGVSAPLLTAARCNLQTYEINRSRPKQ